MVRHGFGYNLGCPSLAGDPMADHTYPGTSTTSDGLAKLPGTNVGLAPAVGIGGISAGVRYLRVTFGVVGPKAIIDDSREPLVLWRWGWLKTLLDCECTVWNEGFIVWERPRRLGSVRLYVCTAALGTVVFVGTEGSVTEDLPARAAGRRLAHYIPITVWRGVWGEAGIICPDHNPIGL